MRVATGRFAVCVPVMRRLLALQVGPEASTPVEWAIDHRTTLALRGHQVIAESEPQWRRRDEEFLRGQQKLPLELAKE